MLNKEEELRLASCIDVIKHDIENTRHPSLTSPGLDYKTQLWLAERLKEINDYCKENHVYKRPPLGVLR